MNLLTQISEAYIPWERSGFLPRTLKKWIKRLGIPRLASFRLRICRDGIASTVVRESSDVKRLESFVEQQKRRYLPDAF